MYSWLVMLPPLLVIIVTITTRHVIGSLTMGIMSACLLATNIQPGSALRLMVQRIGDETHLAGLAGSGSLDHLYTFSFLLILGILIQLMNHSGGIRAYTDFLRSFITTQRAAEQTSLILSTILFIDDYVSTLTVGSVMRPVTDNFSIARAKLALLLDSMSGPLCLIIPASSWVAFILGQMEAAGITTTMGPMLLINQDPLAVYIACIPYLLYPLLIIFSTWIIVSYDLSFGIMHTFEIIAARTGNLYGGKAPLIVKSRGSQAFKGTLLDFIVPIATFIGTFIAALGYSGKSIIMGGTSSFMTTLQSADPFWSLFIASVVALCATISLFFYHNGFQMACIVKACIDGWVLMQNSLLVLLLAWTLSTLLRSDLATGSYLASLIPASISISALPIIIFLLCLILSASTGSVWGTIALMLPLTMPLYGSLAMTSSPDFLSYLYPLLGALFSGAVAGSHFSPITDAMVMTSCSAGCYHIDHVWTQMQYALFPLTGAISGFLVLMVLPKGCSYIQILCSCLVTGILVTTTLLYSAYTFQRLSER